MNQARINHCSGRAWVSGNLSAPHAAYRAGDFVPMRVILGDLTPGATYTLRIDYRAVDHGLHAYDYLGSVDASIHPGQQIIPCSGVANTAGPNSCTSGNPSRRQVPLDTPNVPAGNPGTTFPAGASQRPGEFSAWGAALTGLAYHNCGVPCRSIGPGPPAANADIERQIDVTFHTPASGHTAVLAWGAHIASPLDWGLNRTTAGTRSGSDLRVYFVQIQRHNQSPETTGGKTLTLKPTAVSPPPGLTTRIISTPPVTTDQTVVDEAILTPVAGNAVRGEVQFFVCFNATAPPDCSRNGTPLGLPKVVTANPPPTGPGGAASVEFSADQEIGGEGPGYYCFRARFMPSTPRYSPTLHTNRSTSGAGAECFVATELDPPMLTVTKLCEENDTGVFNFFVDGAPFGAPNVGCGQSRGPLVVAAGVRTVSETAVPPTVITDYTTSFGEDCTQTGAREGSVTVAAGQSKVCVITNTHVGQPTASLTLHKVCDPPSDSRFAIYLNDRHVADLTCGEMTENPVVLQPGVAYTVREAGGDDTSTSDYTTVFSDACAGGSVTLTAGQQATCTITNTRRPGPELTTTTLEVQKACYPPGASGSFNLTIETTDGSRVKQVQVGCGGTTGAVPVEPGSYRVFETGTNGTHLSNYTPVVGDDCEADGTIIVEVGDQSKCVITNTRKAVPSAQLTVTKICVPADDGGRFNLTIDGQTSREVACGRSLGPVVLAPGPHHVSESAGTGTSLSDYTTSIGGACPADGSITLTAGQQVTCTITNVRAGQATGTVEIQKQCSPAGRRERFQLELGQQVFRGIACGQSTGPVVTGVGDRRVGEVAVDEITSLFRTAISGGCSPSGSFTLSAGQHVTCIITNTLVPPKPAPKPPPACYALTVPRRMVTVGRALVVARVHLHGRPIPGVRVYAFAHGVSAVQTTGPTGRAVFLLRLRRPGVLRVRIRRPYLCPPPHGQDIGVLGVSQPSLTG
jgi:hypothetical protein